MKNNNNYYSYISEEINCLNEATRLSSFSTGRKTNTLIRVGPPVLFMN